MDNKLTSKLKKIKLILSDFDGVLTDNMVIHSADGTESVMRCRADSMAIDLLNDAGLYDKQNYRTAKHEIDIVIMSRETNPVVKSVADKIKIKCTQSLYDKSKAFEEEIKKHGLDYSQVLFIGNDLNEIPCMRQSGLGVAVADSHPRVLKVADYITRAPGGRGAFREVCEMILKARGH